MRPISPTTHGTCLVLGAALLWGTLGPTFRALLEEGADPISIALWRTLVGGGVLGGWALLRRPALLRVERGQLPLFAAYGLISVALFFTIYPLAVQLSTVAVAAVLLYTAPAWVALLAAPLFGEVLTARRGVAIAVTFIGSALVAGAYDPAALRANGWGVLAGLASGLTYAGFSLFGKAALRRSAPLTAMGYALFFGALFLVPIALLRPGPFLAPLASDRGRLLLLYIGALPTAGSLLLYSSGLRVLGDAGRASIIATIEPLVAALLGYLLLGEGLEPLQWLGGALILAGVAALARGGSR